MSNVHRLSDLEQGNQHQQRSLFGFGNAPQSGGLAAAPGGGITLLPPMSEIFFPQAKKRSFIAVISVVQVLMFIITLIVGAIKFGGAFVPENSMAGPSSATLSFMGAVNRALLEQGQIWRLLTPVLLHAGIFHIGTNLFFQLSFGFRFEQLWGTKRMAAFYWISGLGGSIMSALFSSPFSVSVGASGALMGLFGAQISFLAMNWNDLRDSGKMMCHVVLIVLINLSFGLTQTGIDNWAHLGGFIFGLLIGAATPVNYNWTSRERIIQRLCIGSVVVLLTLGIIGIYV